MATSSLSHLVLARKWRPERFSELVGQEHVTRTLVRALEKGRIAHAFLFTGVRGVGKTTAARILARCLNCREGPTPEPCGQCAACAEIRAGAALDVVEIDGATYRKIDDARAIIENLSYRPARDRFKVYIIDEAHQLTDQAFNALLKTLEEPPPHVKFILATTEPQKMPETILSRLQRYDFRRIPVALIKARLSQLAEREGIEVEQGALAIIAREAAGSMRDAERMLDTAVAGADGVVTESEVAAILGVAGRQSVYSIAEAILNKDAAGALNHVRGLYGRGATLESLGRDLLEVLRNLAAAKLPRLSGASPLDDLPEAEAAQTLALAEGTSGRDLMRLFRLMAQAQEEIIRSPYPDLLLEMAVVRMATLAPVLDFGELLGALDSASGAARRVRVEGEVKAQAPPRKAAPLSSSATDLPDFRQHVRSRRPALAGFMEQGAALELGGDFLTVIPRSDIYLRYLRDNRGVIAELATELYGRAISVEVAGSAAEGGPPASSSSGAESRSADTSPPATDPKPANARLRGASSVAGAAREPAQTAASVSADERQALYSDPLVRQIFDELGARLVEIRDRLPDSAQETKNRRR